MSKRDKNKYNEYMRVKILERYHNRRSEAMKKLGGKCIVCKTTEDLHFDHIKASEKSFPISKLWSLSKDKYEAEIAKCQLLCRTHHHLKSLMNGDYGGGHNKIIEYDHGSGYMYINDSCRCLSCKKWRKDYREKKVHYNGLPRI
jgi:hypothetical protein